MYDREDLVIPAIVFGTVVIVALILTLITYRSIKESQEWKAFSAEHGCKVVGKKKGELHTGVGGGLGSNGMYMPIVTTTVTPDKTGYLCNDGVTYWR